MHTLLTRITTGHYATREKAVEAVQRAKKLRLITEEQESLLMFSIQREFSDVKQ